ncbi:hypothetical protein TNIN_148251 [Trichonephila inaurata madagascariensis]|uniref:Uncharacterized protein n=1 Tax=Trichonephila inaurata madagascariensis TaxID=2747483 RepID=A0A8X6X486_9ARAC|nr:hypothetical protein TNIN_148251 [Trichonephila inaurata madagascariensis]
MGLVSLICTLLVVVIIIIAVALSKTAHPRSTTLRHSELVYLVPQPRKFINRTPTIVVHRQNPRIWQKHVEDLSTLVKAYRERQGAIATSNCDLHYAPIGVSSCSFPLDRISENCSTQNNFGYDTGNPCVALVFNAFAGWNPIPYNKSNPDDVPVEIRHGYDLQQIVPITCNTSVVVASGSSENASVFHVHYSPFSGFPFRYLPLRGMMGSTLPPLVMIQFIGVSQCRTWRLTATYGLRICLAMPQTIPEQYDSVSLLCEKFSVFDVESIISVLKLMFSRKWHSYDPEVLIRILRCF